MVIRAQVRDDFHADSEDGAVFFYGHFHVVNLVAAMNGGLKILAARFNPLHRRAQTHGGVAHQRFFRIYIQFATKSSADFRSDDAHGMLGDRQHRRNLRAKEVRNLRRGPQGELFFSRQVIGHHAARLHRDGDEPLIDDALLDDLVRLGERLLQVSAFEYPAIRNVVFILFVKNRRAVGDGLLRVHHRSQRVVLNLDKIRGVAHGIAVRPHDHGHRFAHEPHLAHSEHGPRGLLHVGDHRRARHGSDGALHVPPGQNQHHARRRLRLADVHGSNPRVSVRAAHKHGMMHLRQP